MQSAAHLEAFLIKQGLLFLAHLKCFGHVQRRAHAIARLICRSLISVLQLFVNQVLKSQVLKLTFSF